MNNWTRKDGVIMTLFLFGLVLGSAQNAGTGVKVLPGYVLGPVFLVSMFGMCLYPILVSRRSLRVKSDLCDHEDVEELDLVERAEILEGRIESLEGQLDRVMENVRELMEREKSS